MCFKEDSLAASKQTLNSTYFQNITEAGMKWITAALLKLWAESLYEASFF